MMYPNELIYTECDSKDCQKEARPFLLFSEGVSWGRKYYTYECRLCKNRIRLQEKELEKVVDINTIQNPSINVTDLEIMRGMQT